MARADAMAPWDPLVAKHIVCLTFNLDGIASFIARGQTSPSLISRGEYGVHVGVPRILALLKQFGVRATWFVPGHTIETYPAAVEAVAAAGHEIAHHGWTHRAPSSLTSEEEEAELVRGNEAIERAFGRKASGYRAPSLDISSCTVDLLVRNGFLYDSSMMGDDHSPYYARVGDVIELEAPGRFGTMGGLIEMPVSWSTTDSAHFEYMRTPTHVRQGLMPTRLVEENWIADWRYLRETADWGVLTYTLHPHVIGRGHRMLMLERLIECMLGEGAVFQRMDETAAEFKSRGRPGGLA